MALSFDQWLGKVAIVTGASSGIGAAIVEKLVENGLIVVGLARRREKLEELSNKLSNQSGQFHPFECDITVENDTLNAFEWTLKHLGPVQILINNAGVLTHGNLCEGEVASWKKVLDTNVIARCIATREAIKQLKSSKLNGQIIHINSVLGHTVYNIPGLDIYAPSQYAITAMAETLRYEMINMQLDVKITSISPGPVQTDMLGNSEDLPIKKFLKPEDVAAAILYVLSTPPHVQVQELILRPLNEPL